MTMLTEILLLHCFVCLLFPPSSDNHLCTKVIMYDNDDYDDNLDDKNIGQDSTTTSAMLLLLLQCHTRVKGIQASTAVRIFWDNFCVCCLSCALHWVAVLMEWWSDGCRVYSGASKREDLLAGIMMMILMMMMMLWQCQPRFSYCTDLPPKRQEETPPEMTNQELAVDKCCSRSNSSELKVKMKTSVQSWWTQEGW